MYFVPGGLTLRGGIRHLEVNAGRVFWVVVAELLRNNGNSDAPTIRKIFFGEGRRDFVFEQNADLHKYVRHMMK